MSSPQLPPKAKKIIEEYVRDKLAGAYGHPRHRLKLFRAKLDAAGFFIHSPIDAYTASHATPLELDATFATPHELEGNEDRARLSR